MQIQEQNGCSAGARSGAAFGGCESSGIGREHHKTMLDHDRQTKNLLVRGSGFSLEAPDGVRFLIRSRLFTDEELADLPDVRSGPIDGPR